MAEIFVRAPECESEALVAIGAGLDFLAGTDAFQASAAVLEETVLEETVRGLSRGIDRAGAARGRYLRAFEAAGGPQRAGAPTVASWLGRELQQTKSSARNAVALGRLLEAHPVAGQAVLDGDLSVPFADKVAGWVERLPEADREAAESILVGAAVDGVGVSDLNKLAAAIYEKTRTTPDAADDDKSFADRYVSLQLTFGGAGRLSGDLTPESAAALRIVLEALGKKKGQEDDRTPGQRTHDALHEAMNLLVASGKLPDRAGQKTQVQVHVPLCELRGLDGASVLEEAWLAARAGEPGYLTGAAAEAISCDASIFTVVTGVPDWAVIGQVVEIAGVFHAERAKARAAGCDLSPEAVEAAMMQIARLAIGFCSGPEGIAAVLRRGLLEDGWDGCGMAGPSVPLDVSCGDTVPAALRRAVILRDRHCAWPGCTAEPTRCEVHHLVPRKSGGQHSLANCVLLCWTHHQVFIHRLGWSFVLHPDGTTQARSPGGQVLRSHPSPCGYGPPCTHGPPTGPAGSRHHA
jgi:hypothetical protein